MSVTYSCAWRKGGSDFEDAWDTYMLLQRDTNFECMDSMYRKLRIDTPNVLHRINHIPYYVYSTIYIIRGCRAHYIWYEPMTIKPNTPIQPRV